MKILDIDMDYFVNPVVNNISENSEKRLDSEIFSVWDKEEIIRFLEDNLKLSKDKRIKGRIITHHNEALYYWKDLIYAEEINIPFEVVHIDSHADLGLGYNSWVFIFEKLLGIEVANRDKIENYDKMFNSFCKPGIGDYLLYAIAFRWISKLKYICNPTGDGDDVHPYIMKNLEYDAEKIQLSSNKINKATDLNDEYNWDNYLENSILEPEVDFKIVKKVIDVKYEGDFDRITFCISPNYTPQSADFIIDIIKNYIIEE